MITFLRDRKVRDILWQVAATAAMVAVIWFFVQNASENMVKAGIASGFHFLWRDSGIEVPFNITGYKPSDNLLALLWTGIVNTLLVSAASIVVAQLAAVDPGGLLHRVRAQHPAAVLRAVLVLRRAGGVADAAREL
jgi:general L-amino acid transport system permease protein